MAALMGAVAEDGITVVLSSHVVSELERVSDYLVVLGRGQVQLCGDVGDLLAMHCLLTGPTDGADAVAASVYVVDRQHASRQTQIVARVDAAGLPPGWEASPVNLEELVLAYLRSPSARALTGPRHNLSTEASA
jgi:ABC-2 type transport system ATP-binding protein